MNSQTENERPQESTSVEVIVPQARATRRMFSPSQKTRILEEVAQAKRGEVGAILRREGIYSAHVKKWKAQLNRSKAISTSPVETARLLARAQKAEAELRQAQAIIAVQKKFAELLGVMLPSNGEVS